MRSIFLQYRTLMTRGMKGCYVYCTESALAQYLRDRIVKVKDQTPLLKVAQESESYEYPALADKPTVNENFGNGP